MSLLSALKEFFFGPAKASDKHPLDGPTKRAIVQPEPPAPATPPAPAATPAEKYEVNVAKDWPFVPPVTVTVEPGQGEVKVKKPRKPRAPKAAAAPKESKPAAIKATKSKKK